MIPIPDDARIFLHGGLVDLRNGFDGLAFLAHLAFKDDIISETYFVFINPRRTRMKVLYWNGDNLAIWYIRLQKDVFFLRSNNLKNSKISKFELQMIINKQTPTQLFCPQNN